MRTIKLTITSHLVNWHSGQTYKKIPSTLIYNVNDRTVDSFTLDSRCDILLLSYFSQLKSLKLGHLTHELS
jgi:hypothetical protein